MRPLIALAARRAPVRVAKRCDLDAKQLQFGAHVRAAECRRLARERRRNDPRHLIAWCHQPENFVLPQRAFADGENRRVAGAALVVNHDAAALASRKPRRLRKAVLRANARRKDNQIGMQAVAIGKLHRQSALLFHNRGGGFAGMHADIQRLDFLAQHRSAWRIELHRHQPRRKLHDVRFQPQLFKRVRRLKPQQAAAHHHAARGMLRAFTDGVEIVKRAVDETARQVTPRHRRHKRPGAGGKHQFVKMRFVTLCVAHDLPRAIQRHNLTAGA